MIPPDEPRPDHEQASPSDQRRRAPRNRPPPRDPYDDYEEISLRGVWKAYLAIQDLKYE